MIDFTYRYVFMYNTIFIFGPPVGMIVPSWVGNFWVCFQQIKVVWCCCNQVANIVVSWSGQWDGCSTAEFHIFVVDVRFQGKVLFDDGRSLAVKWDLVDVFVFGQVVVFQVAGKLGMSLL